MTGTLQHLVREAAASFTDRLDRYDRQAIADRFLELLLSNPSIEWRDEPARDDIDHAAMAGDGWFLAALTPDDTGRRLTWVRPRRPAGASMTIIDESEAP
jgi:hypothetical protein